MEKRSSTLNEPYLSGGVVLESQEAYGKFRKALSFVLSATQGQVDGTLWATESSCWPACFAYGPMGELPLLADLSGKRHVHVFPMMALRVGLNIPPNKSSNQRGQI